MAAIDSMLRVMSMRGAEVLIICTGEVPTLRRKGEPQPMSMPPMDPDLVESFLAEITSDEQRERLAQTGNLDILHRTGDGTRFAVLLELLDARVPDTGPRIRMSFRPAGRASAPGASAATPPAPSSLPSPQPRDGSSTDARATSWPSDGARVGAGISRTIERVLASAQARGASDILLSSTGATRMKIDGGWIALHELCCTEAELVSLINDGAALEGEGGVDLAFDSGGARYRANVFRHQDGVTAAVRPIRTDPPTLEELDLPGSLSRLTRYPHGLVLMTGPAGSGKSTTLVALVEEMNRSRTKHIVTIEDPIEYQYTSDRSMIHQREVGRDVPSFAAGLRAALRQAPDVILLGEMRDLDTISAALTAAETGHLVLATLHCADAASAVDRVIDVFPAHQQRQVRSQLALALRAVVTQVLLPRRHGGRVPAYELLVVNNAVANLIREDKTYQLPTAIATSKSDGMVPLERTLAGLVRSGQIDRSVARAACLDPTRFDDLTRVGAGGAA